MEKTKIDRKIKDVQERFERHKKEWEEIRDIFINDSSSWTLDRSQRYTYLEAVIKKEEDQWLELLEQLDAIDKKREKLESP